MNKILLIVFLMLVTYIPRLTPFVASKLRKDTGRAPSPLLLRLEFILKMVPYAALGALIIPGGLTAIPDQPLISMGGLAAAAVVSFFSKNMTLAITASVAAVYLGLITT